MPYFTTHRRTGEIEKRRPRGSRFDASAIRRILREVAVRKPRRSRFDAGAIPRFLIIAPATALLLFVAAGTSSAARECPAVPDVREASGNVYRCTLPAEVRAGIRRRAMMPTTASATSVGAITASSRTFYEPGQRPSLNRVRTLGRRPLSRRLGVAAGTPSSAVSPAIKKPGVAILPLDILVLIVDFIEDISAATSGDGKFRSEAAWPDYVPHDFDYLRRMMDHHEAYWATVSCSLFTPSFILHPEANPAAPETFTMPGEMSVYGGGNGAAGSASLLGDATAAADPWIDFADFSGVMILHAGCGEEADLLGDSPDDIWSTYLATCDIDGLLGTSGGLPTEDGVNITEVAVVPETETWDSEEGDYSSIYAPLGVYAHEFAHYLGIPDLYDTESPPALDSWGIGSWGIMGLGAWNAAGFSPPHPCAWIKSVLGWVDIETVDRPGGAFELPFSEGDAGSGEIPIVLAAPLTGSEYFLIENRLQDEDGNGRFSFTSSSPADTILDFFDHDADDSMVDAEFDYFLPGEGEGSGILVWHIDDSVIEENSGPCVSTVNNDKYRKGVDLEEADGIQHLDRIPGNWGSRYDAWRSSDFSASFSAESNPSSEANNGGRSHVTVDSIGPAGTLMKLRVKWEHRQDGWPLVLEGDFSGDGLSAADLDGDGFSEILAAASSGEIYIIEHDGTPFLDDYAGVDIVDGLSGPPAAGQIDGGAGLELAAASSDGKMYAWNAESGAQGVELLSGWPFVCEGLILVPPVIPGGAVGILVCESHPGGAGYESGAVSLVTPEGEVAWRYETAGGIAAKPALAGGSMVAVHSDDGTLHALNLETGEPAWSFSGLESTAESPLILDADRDGLDDIVIAESSGDIHMFRIDGSTLPGWPTNLPGRCYAPPGVSDQDGDGYPDILVSTSEPARLVRLEFYGGTMVDHPPLDLPGDASSAGILTTSPLSARFSGEGAALAIVSSPEGIIYGFDDDGDQAGIFPLLCTGPLYSSPVIADLDGDGALELAVACDAGGDVGGFIEIEIWEPSGSENGSDVFWGMAGGDPALASRFDASQLGEPHKEETGPLLAGGSVFCAPNPATREGVNIYYMLSRPVERVSLDVFTFDGRRVYSKRSSDPVYTSAGGHTKITWLPGNRACGVYLAKLAATDGTRTEEKMIMFALGGK